MSRYADIEPIIKKIKYSMEIGEIRGRIWFEMVLKDLEELPAVDAVPVACGKWIPFKMRKPDPDELEYHPDWTYVLDGQLPDEGQRILVNCVFKGHEAVQLDEFYTDADGCYLDSGYEIGTEVSAWMPLPEPYKMDEVTE